MHLTELFEAHVYSYKYWGWINPAGQLLLPSVKDQTHLDILERNNEDGYNDAIAINGWVRWFVDAENCFYITYSTVKLVSRQLQTIKKLLKDVDHSFDILFFRFEDFNGRGTESRQFDSISEANTFLHQELMPVLTEAHQLRYNYWGWINNKGKLLLPVEKDKFHDHILYRLKVHMDTDIALSRGWVRWYVERAEAFVAEFSPTKISETALKELKKTLRDSVKTFNIKNIYFDSPLGSDEYQSFSSTSVFEAFEYLNTLKVKEPELVTEEHVFHYKYWGIITPEGKVILPLETDKGHGDLFHRIGKSWIDIDRRGYVRWYLDSNNDFYADYQPKLLTRKSKKSLKGIMKDCANMGCTNFIFDNDKILSLSKAMVKLSALQEPELVTEEHMYGYRYWGIITGAGKIIYPNESDRSHEDLLYQLGEDWETVCDIGWVRWYLDMDDYFYAAYTELKPLPQPVVKSLKIVLRDCAEMGCMNFILPPGGTYTFSKAMAKLAAMQKQEGVIEESIISNLLSDLQSRLANL